MFSHAIRLACSAVVATTLLCSTANAAQIINFGGNLTLTNSTVFNMSVEGPVRGSGYDSLAVAGQATLAGTLNFLITNGFVPSAGEQFLAVSYGSYTGAFGSIRPFGLSNDLFLTADYRATGLVLTVNTTEVAPTPVPEPSSLALIGSALVGLALVRRRQRS